MRITGVRWVSLLLGCIASNLAHAGAPAQWYDNVTIRYLYAGQSGDRVAIGINMPLDGGTCSSSNGEFVLDPLGNPHFKTIMALLTSAYMADKTISIFTNGTCMPTGVLLTDVRIP